MQNIRNESRQEPKILKKKTSKIHGRYVGEFQPQKEIPTTLKYVFFKNSTIPPATDIVGKIILASFSLNVTLQ